MDDKEHVKRLVDAVYAAGEAIREARRAGLTVEIHQPGLPDIPLSVTIHRITPLFVVGRVNVTDE